MNDSKNTYDIAAWARHFAHIYGRKNALLMAGLHERAVFLLKATRYVQDTIRKHAGDGTKLRKAMASLFSRLMAVADHFRDFPFVDSLCRKYPESGCGYCGEKPCACATAKRRENPSDVVPTGTQMRWSLDLWQKHLFDTYGTHNAAAGIDGTLLRLFAEVTEVFMLTEDVSFHARGPDAIEAEYAKEIADVFSWICALASLLDIDLAEAVDMTYGRGCPGCNQTSCICTRIFVHDGKVESADSMPAPARGSDGETSIGGLFTVK